ncbi:hypothetical protein RJ640_023588 [Escallonia rubra]|uniref:Glutamate receptor n=1 Tax=Escallonia rubra TaxID=112253 RepID=A0AA88UEG3_9ASTE|nr:hypothetical protein RJ640_023588 [Escallonia rubra]
MEFWANNRTLLSSLIFLSLAASEVLSHNSSATVASEINVGVILDMGSWVGKTIHSCITMAVTDFYAENAHHKTRMILHTRDSKGEPLRALSAALDLLENLEVHAIIGPETSLETNLLAILGDKAKVPILSFAARPPSSAKHPFLLSITQSESAQLKCIATIIESFKWRDVIVIYEDTDYRILPLFIDSFKEKNIHIAYWSAISPSASNGQILEELHKLRTMHTKVFVVHMSPSLASRFFVNANRLGMMHEGSAWLITDQTVNVMDTMDSEVIESLQGALGIKSYNPPSAKLRDFTLRWQKNCRTKALYVALRKLNVLGIRTYDATRALAMAIERVRVENLQARKQNVGLNLSDLAGIGASPSGASLLRQMLEIRFSGLGGDFQLMNEKQISDAFEIVNMIYKGERRVGLWTTKDGLTKEIQSGKLHPSSSNALEEIIWPGGRKATPKGWMMPMNGETLRIGVPVKLGFPTSFLQLSVDHQTNKSEVTGFCVDVFHAAIEALPYEVPYEFVPFVTPTGESAGSYTDLIDEVFYQKFDAVVGDITITSNRSLYVDFTLPFTDLGVGTVAPLSNSMWIFLEPLEGSLWVTTACFFILTGFVIWVIEHAVNEEFQGQKLLSNLSRFVVTIWVFVVLIMTSSYTATLSSLMTVRQIQLASKGLSIGYQAGSLEQGIIGNNTNFVDNTLRPYNSSQDYADALSKGSKHGGVDAIIDEIPYIKAFLASYPGYAMIGSEPTTNGFAFAFRKGSPLVTEMSREIAKLREEGKLRELEKKWFKSESTLSP